MHDVGHVHSLRVEGVRVARRRHPPVTDPPVLLGLHQHCSAGAKEVPNVQEEGGHEECSQDLRVVMSDAHIDGPLIRFRCPVCAWTPPRDY